MARTAGDHSKSQRWRVREVDFHERVPLDAVVSQRRTASLRPLEVGEAETERLLDDRGADVDVCRSGKERRPVFKGGEGRLEARRGRPERDAERRRARLPSTTRW